MYNENDSMSTRNLFIIYTPKPLRDVPFIRIFSFQSQNISEPYKDIAKGLNARK